MGNAARKARKRAGTPFQHPEKTPTPRRSPEPNMTARDEALMWRIARALAMPYGRPR